MKAEKANFESIACTFFKHKTILEKVAKEGESPVRKNRVEKVKKFK